MFTVLGYVNWPQAICPYQGLIVSQGLSLQSLALNARISIEGVKWRRSKVHLISAIRAGLQLCITCIALLLIAWTQQQWPCDQHDEYACHDVKTACCSWQVYSSCFLNRLKHRLSVTWPDTNPLKLCQLLLSNLLQTVTCLNDSEWSVTKDEPTEL